MRARLCRNGMVSMRTIIGKLKYFNASMPEIKRRYRSMDAKTHRKNSGELKALQTTKCFKSVKEIRLGPFLLKLF